MILPAIYIFFPYSLIPWLWSEIFILTQVHTVSVVMHLVQRGRPASAYILWHQHDDEMWMWFRLPGGIDDWKGSLGNFTPAALVKIHCAEWSYHNAKIQRTIQYDNVFILQLEATISEEKYFLAIKKIPKTASETGPLVTCLITITVQKELNKSQEAVTLLPKCQNEYLVFLQIQSTHHSWDFIQESWIWPLIKKGSLFHR